jgi:ATP/maltotriose-dependent transcriptional regulator MalT
MESMPRRVSSPKFVGRSEELSALSGALDRATGGSPAFAFVAGESGVGKSRLVSELESHARQAGARVLVGHCLELGGTVIPYAPLVGALRPLAREAGCTDLAERLPAERRAALAELLPEFAAAPDAPPAPADGGGQSRVFEALLALLEELGRDAPLLLVLEDLHWADPSTRDFLVFLVRSARTEPLCLVATYRSDELHRRHPLRPLLAELERASGVERIGLERFSRDEVAEQLAGILDGPAPEELADRLFARSEGNALYTEELLAVTAEGCRDLPETLRDALLTRVERLPAAAQEVVRVVSVEHPMRHELLAELSPLPAAEVLAGVREAVAHQVLVTGSGDTYAFRHALVGEAVYGDLLPGERSAQHAQLAEALERSPELLGDAPPAAVAAQLARHWNGAHDLPRALGASVAAGRAARRMLAPSEAKRHFERALELWDRVPDAAERAGCDHVEVLRLAAATANHSGESGRAVALIRQASAEVDERADPGRAAYLLERLGHYLRGAGETEESFRAYDQAMGLLPDGATPERARLQEHHSRAMMLRGHFHESAELAATALEAARRHGDPQVEGRALNTLGMSRAALGEVEEGLALLRASRELAARHGPPAAHMQAVVNLTELLDLSGHTEEALAEVLAAMEAVRSQPERTVYDTFLELQGISQQIRLGRLAELEPGLPIQTLGDSSGPTPIFLHELRARVAVLQGDRARASEELAELRRLSLGTRDPQVLEPLHGLSAELALEEERPADARAAVAQGLAALERSEEGARTIRLCWIGLMVEAEAAARGRALGDPFDPAVAERLAARLARAEGEPAQWAEGPLYAALAHAELRRLHAALGAAAASDGDGAPPPNDPAAWEAAAAGFERHSWPWPAAYARYRAGEAHVAAGDRAAAATPLAAAHAAALAMGAAPLLREVESLARRARVDLAGAAAEGRPAAPAADRLGLTPREHEVLLLVAEGRTNREIGASLFMSEKTASVHVSRILAKLGVGGRVEAAAVAHRLGITA